MSKEITSLQHPLVKHLVKLRQNRDYRYEQKMCVVEGIKLVRELSEKIAPKVILTKCAKLIPSHISSEAVFLTSDAVMSKISGLQNPEGIIAEIPIPPFESLTKKRYILGLDSINDPGNLGTLLRTAFAFRWEGVFLLNDCCDPFNEKALRAAKGATFHLPLGIGRTADLEHLIENSKIKTVVADLKGTPFQNVDSSKGLLLILGNEAKGPAQWIKQKYETITIPMEKNTESLNVGVAGGILMYGLRGKQS